MPLPAVRRPSTTALAVGTSAGAAAGAAAGAKAGEPAYPVPGTLLVAGRAVGWFQGRMEFGPRALGTRSILADAERYSTVR